MMFDKQRAKRAAKAADSKAEGDSESTKGTEQQEVENSGDEDLCAVDHDEDEDLTETERLERERDEYLAKWQRAQADYQNLRRRLVTDLDDARRRAKEGVFAELLVILDYLDMAAATPCESQEAKNLLMGVELTRAQFTQLLEREGIAPIPVDLPFDPALHDAIESVPTDEHAPGTLLETVRKGYRMGEHVLRFAQVKVAAEPKAEAGDEEA